MTISLKANRKARGLGMSYWTVVTAAGRLVREMPSWVRRRKNKKRLKAMLEVPNYEFGRRIETLQGSIGADREETEYLLLQIGARPSISDASVWILKSPLGLGRWWQSRVSLRR